MFVIIITCLVIYVCYQHFYQLLCFPDYRERERERERRERDRERRDLLLRYSESGRKKIAAARHTTSLLHVHE